MTAVPKTTLEELIHVEPLDQVDDLLLLANEFVEKHRWYDKRRLVFSIEGDLFAATYAAPATELQEDMEPFEGQPAMVEVVPVVAVERMVTFFEDAP